MTSHGMLYMVAFTTRIRAVLSETSMGRLMSISNGKEMEE